MNGKTKMNIKAKKWILSPKKNGKTKMNIKAKKNGKTKMNIKAKKEWLEKNEY